MEVRRERWMRTYRIVRVFKRQDLRRRVMRAGLSLPEALTHMRSTESCSKTCRSPGARHATRLYGEWIDYYESEVDNNGKIVRFSAGI